MDAPGARAGGIGADRNRVPVREAEVAACRIRRRIAPWLRPFHSFRRTVRGAVILGLGGQTHPAPRRVGGRFVVRGVHRRVERKRYEAEHGAPLPLAVLSCPEVRRRRTRGRHVREVLAVRDVVPVDRKRFDVDTQRRELVVPAEVIRIAAERGRAGRDRNLVVHDVRWCSRECGGDRRARSLLRVRQLVKHVEQRLLVHLLVLQDGEGRLPVIAVDITVAECMDEHGVGGVTVVLNGSAPRPEIGRRLRQGLVFRIDAAREERLVVLVDALLFQHELDQRVDREGRQVPFVEDDRVAQRNGAVVVRLFARNSENLLRDGAPLAIPADQAVAGDAVWEGLMPHLARNSMSAPPRRQVPRSHETVRRRDCCSS